MQRLEQKLPEYLDAALRKVRNRADQPRSAVHGPQFIAGLRCAANMIEEAGRRAAILASQPEAACAVDVDDGYDTEAMREALEWAIDAANCSAHPFHKQYRGALEQLLAKHHAAALREQVTPAGATVEGLARWMFEDQADGLAAPWDRQWEPTKEFWRRRATSALAQAAPGKPKHGDDAGDGLRYVMCQFGAGDHYRDMLLIPHADGQYITAAKLQPFGAAIMRAQLAKADTTPPGDDAAGVAP